MGKPRKLLTIAHSYVVTLNRRLAHEMARLGGREWEVTAVAPTYFHGGREIRPIQLQLQPNEPCRVLPIAAHLTRFVHFFVYGWQLRQILAEPWDLVHCWEEPFVVASRQILHWTNVRCPVVLVSAQNLYKHYPPPFNWIERSCSLRGGMDQLRPDDCQQSQSPPRLRGAAVAYHSDGRRCRALSP